MKLSKCKLRSSLHCRQNQTFQQCSTESESTSANWKFQDLSEATERVQQVICRTNSQADGAGKQRISKPAPDTRSQASTHTPRKPALQGLNTEPPGRQSEAEDLAAALQRVMRQNPDGGVEIATMLRGLADEVGGKQETPVSLLGQSERSGLLFGSTLQPARFQPAHDYPLSAAPALQDPPESVLLPASPATLQQRGAQTFGDKVSCLLDLLQALMLLRQAHG